MHASEVQGPLPAHIPATRSNAYGDHLRALGRTRSLPILGESSRGPSSGRRTHSESALTIIPPPPPPFPRPTPAPLSPRMADDPAPDQPASAPSPVPTEIISPELTQEEIVVDIQRSGIKVRDFAYEVSSVPRDQHATELFDPVLAWHMYEALLDNPNPARNALNGRHMRRLLDLGWISQHIDDHRWLQKDREALDKFDSRPYYSWRALGLTQPNKDDLREVATTRFQWVNADQLVPQFVRRGIPRFAAVIRGSRKLNAAPRPPKRPITDATQETGQEQDSDTSPRLKKRRLSTVPESAPPYPPAHFPLMLVNGKPPQQFPAGRPSETPPRTTTPPLPTQGTLSRSLQRHLSTSISSPCTSDISRSDSRCTTSPLSESTRALVHGWFEDMRRV